MRKIFFLLIIIIIIVCVFCRLIIIKSDRVMPTFNENVNNYDVYILDLSKENINTSNIMNYFDNIKIIEIYPYINPIYKKLINLSSYSFNTILSNKKNISLFINDYLTQIENNSLKDEMVKYKVNGIKVNKIKVYASSKEISYLINNYNIKMIK